MAASHIKSGTTQVGATVTAQVTGTEDGILVINRTPELGELWVTANGDAVAVAGDGSIPIATSATIDARCITRVDGVAAVKLTSAVALAYTIVAGDGVIFDGAA